MRDENGDIFAGEDMEVAVKEFAVSRKIASAKLPQFMREVFLRKSAQHPCIVQTLGGYWPDPDEAGDDDQIEACLVMERMSCNLEHAQYKQLLESEESKRRILSDVAAGIAYLHRRRIAVS